MKTFCLSAIVTSLFVLPALAEPVKLTEPEIRAEIIDTKLKGHRVGMTASIFHASDGTTTVNAFIRKRKGRWEIVDDQLCITWNGEDEAKCNSILRRGEGRYELDPQGMTFEVKD